MNKITPKMFSTSTLLELMRVIDNYTHDEIDRIVDIFSFNKPFAELNPSKLKKSTQIFNDLKRNSITGPFTGNLYTDLLQYLINDFFHKNPRWERGHTEYYFQGETKTFTSVFSVENKNLSNSLMRDGFKIEGKTIKKLLPEEIEENKSESELFRYLDKFDFNQSKNHLQQAISNHTQGNWEGANSQFRTFTESLLIEICKKIQNSNEVSSAIGAIKLLSQTVNPPFLSSNLNEVNYEKSTDPTFVNGLWARLNPSGSHPGFSDKDDSTFRYHISIVFGYYLLNRLNERLK